MRQEFINRGPVGSGFGQNVSTANDFDRSALELL
jgi:hypothetical protein